MKTEDEAYFADMANQWKRFNFYSVSSKIDANHPAYQRIIEMGEKAVPFILAELKKEPDHWFLALNSITKANPVSPSNQGNLEKMAADWIKWGVDHGYI